MANFTSGSKSSSSSVTLSSSLLHPCAGAAFPVVRPSGARKHPHPVHRPPRRPRCNEIVARPVVSNTSSSCDMTAVPLLRKPVATRRASRPASTYARRMLRIDCTRRANFSRASVRPVSDEGDDLATDHGPRRFDRSEEKNAGGIIGSPCRRDKIDATIPRP